MQQVNDPISYRICVRAWGGVATRSLSLSPFSGLLSQRQKPHTSCEEEASFFSRNALRLENVIYGDR